MASIEELKKRYRGQWLAIRVTREEGGVSVDGVLIARDRDPKRLHEKLRTKRVKDALVIYAGPLVPKGYKPQFSSPALGPSGR